MPVESSGSLLPSNPSFAGHQTFAVRSAWLKKGMDALYNEAAGGFNVFVREDALVTLGVGKNMVQSIRHWLLVTRMAEAAPNGRGLQPSPLGKAVFGTPVQEGWDAYLEDEATLWLLHWLLAGPGSQAYSWAWTFNRFREYEFNQEALADSVLSGMGSEVPRKPSRETVQRDVDCVLHTYVAAEGSTLTEDNLDCPLQTLGLIRPSFRRHYRLQVGPKPSLSPGLFAYALLIYWQWRQPSALTMTVWDATYGEGSPGMVFKLDEDSVLEYLDATEVVTDGGMRFEDSSLTRQVVRDENAKVTPMMLLEAHYNA